MIDLLTPTKKVAKKHFLVSGNIAKDVHVKIPSLNSLPSVFKRLWKDCTPISKVQETLGAAWSFEKVIACIDNKALSQFTYSYGGRATNVAYGAASLGAPVELLTLVGGDFDKLYLGFSDGSYRRHLQKAGVIINELEVTTYDHRKIDDENLSQGILSFKDKEIPTIYCIKDFEGNDMYFIDDKRGVHTLANSCPIPKKLIQEYSGVFVTSGERNYNKKLIDYAYKQNKEVLFDVGAYDLTDGYLQEVIPKCTKVFGNVFEIDLVKRAFEVNEISDLFDVSSQISMILLEDKIACTVKMFERGRDPVFLGPVLPKKRVSSVGCCDGIATGYLALNSLGYDNLTAVKAGLLQCASIWEVDGVQEGMLSQQRLFELIGTPIPQISTVTLGKNQR